MKRIEGNTSCRRRRTSNSELCDFRSWYLLNMISFYDTMPRRKRKSVTPCCLPQGLLLLTCLLAAAPAVTSAWDLQGTKTITANTRDKQRIALGTVRFEPQGGESASFVVTMDRSRFSDHFLSMKVFKCLDGQGELVCHVPYPYSQPSTVTATDMTWLEHSLLFLYKLPNDFGANLWNGLYFRLERTDRGLLGRPQAIDLNRISAPPDDPDVPPYCPTLREDITPGARWIEFLTIE